MVPRAAAWKNLLLAIGGAAALAATEGVPAGAAPAAKPRPIPAQLVGTTWRAKTIAGRPVAGTVTSTLTFLGAGRIAGHGGCNSYGGPLSHAGGRLRIGPLVVTNMACVSPRNAVMRQEARFLASLEAAGRLSFEGPLLVLRPRGRGAPTRLARVGQAAGG